MHSFDRTVWSKQQKELSISIPIDICCHINKLVDFIIDHVFSFP